MLLKTILNRIERYKSFVYGKVTMLEAVRLLHQREEDLRNFKARLQGRLDRLDRREGIEIEDEAALQAFFDDVQTQGRQRYEASQVAS